MKLSHITKTILLALPVITLLYIFYFRDGAENGIGGGSYDLTNVYYALFAAAYLLVLNIVLLAQDARGNKYFLLAGGVLLIGAIAAVVLSF